MRIAFGLAIRVLLAVHRRATMLGSGAEPNREVAADCAEAVNKLVMN